MTNEEKQIKTVKNIVLRGFVKHSEIDPRLKHVGILHVDADQVAGLTMEYKHGESGGLDNKIVRGIRRLTDKIISYIFAILGASVFAEFVAAQAFTGSLIDTKLQGFGDHFLYWLGMKSIEINGPEMITALGTVVAVTPKIVKGMILGGAVGYVSWKVFTWLICFIYKRSRLKRKIKKLIKQST